MKRVVKANTLNQIRDSKSMRIEHDELDDAISPTDPLGANESVLVYRNGSPLGIHPTISDIGDDDSSSLRRTRGKGVKEINLFKNMKTSSK